MPEHVVSLAPRRNFIDTVYTYKVLVIPSVVLGILDPWQDFNIHWRNCKDVRVNEIMIKSI